MMVSAFHDSRWSCEMNYIDRLKQVSRKRGAITPNTFTSVDRSSIEDGKEDSHCVEINKKGNVT